MARIGSGGRPADAAQAGGAVRPHVHPEHQQYSTENQEAAIRRHAEQKSLHTDRVVLVPGPPEETAIVREIYQLFVDEVRP